MLIFTSELYLRLPLFSIVGFTNTSFTAGLKVSTVVQVLHTSETTKHPIAVPLFDIHVHIRELSSNSGIHAIILDVSL